MLDRYNRNIHYLRISVTDRCNLRCKYCMPEEGVHELKHEDILSFEEIIDFTKVAIHYGIDKVRITGGEPLVRKNIITLIKMLSDLKGLSDLSLTTNGILLEEFAKPLVDAGIKRVNISLDTLDAEKFKDITRGGDISKVIRGIEAAKNAGINPIKINCVINSSSDEPDALAVNAFCEKKELFVRFIHKMNLETGEFSIVEGGTGGNCRLCNKLRLSSDGYLRPCLFNDSSFNIRQLGAEKALQTAIEAKPECGTFSVKNKFNRIGG
jgi:GTP 3',8-cyclase